MRLLLALNTTTVVIDENLFSPAKSIPTVSSLVNVVLKNAFVFAGVIFFVLLILGGFSFIMSAGGDAKKAEKGKQTITAAVTGLAIVITAYWIIRIIEILTGINILNAGL